MIYFFIPARAGSKGWPGKNKKLFDITADLVRNQNVIVSSDDGEILKKSKEYNFIPVTRDKEYSQDTSDMICVFEDAIGKLNLKDDDVLFLLYLTSPSRTIKDIKFAINKFFLENCKSLVCRKKVKTNPYMCIDENGKQIIKHDFYRRQDYPLCYEITHYVAIYRISEIKKLNKQLFNDETTWWDIEDKLDVDYEKDFIQKGVLKND